MEVKRDVASIPEDSSQNKVATFVCNKDLDYCQCKINNLSGLRREFFRFFP